ncbi:hypothetical protein AG1IA_04766 [Rhizoctonia solani AG-1 IA]|uniref:Uncharacterized protein n=1 Tax=Thanatephorus cucumeris (strain AG1-IA) TaxID=983506 RepID=L8WXX5_THACA|nr:hypothetical protein AG1IA_04766 [Rhizoctonia solani AG-1 IA]
MVRAAHPRARLAVRQPCSTLAASQPQGFPKPHRSGSLGRRDKRAEDELLHFVILPHSISV